MVLAATVVAVVLAAAAGGLLAIWSFTTERRVSAGTVSLSVSPFHRGSLDVYVPLVDWGVRFDGVRAPARLEVELQTVDRAAVEQMVRTGLPATRSVRADARDAVASYLRTLALLTAAGALALGLLMLAALRPPAWRPFVAAPAAVAALWVAAIALLVAPRGELTSYQYYAHGGDIPAALRVVENASAAPGALSEELDNQLLGLARLVDEPGSRRSISGLSRLTVASDLHNNVVAISAIRRAAAGGPVILAGDLTDRGTAAEAAAVASVASAGEPVVFVGGNHDSDTSSRRFADAGAIVLTRRGRLHAGGRYGPMITRVRGLRIAGYESPNLRRKADGYADKGAEVNDAQRHEFAAWLEPLVGHVDVVVVHEPDLASAAVAALRARRPGAALLFVFGHTHHQAVRSAAGVLEVNGGTVGAGGTGNLGERQAMGLALVSYERSPFAPVAADLVQIAPETGAGTARRVRLDDEPVDVGDIEAPAPEPATTGAAAPP